VKVQLHAFLTTVLDGGEWSACFAPGKELLYHWVDPIAGLDTVEKRKIAAPAQIQIPIARSCSPVFLNRRAAARYRALVL
jgi:hypothetical protein